MGRRNAHAVSAYRRKAGVMWSRPTRSELERAAMEEQDELVAWSRWDEFELSEMDEEIGRMTSGRRVS